MDAPTPFERCVAAPVMGFGLGVDVFDDSPSAEVLIKQHRAGFDFLELYTRGDWEHTAFMRELIPSGLPHTYHHEGLDPTGPELCPEGPIAGCISNLAMLNAPWVVEELAIRHIDGRYTDFFFPAVLTDECLRRTVDNLLALQDRIPTPLLPEIPPFEFVVGDMHVLDFLREVAHRCEMGVVLDIGHLLSWQLCVGKGDPPLDQIERMDLSRVIEVHLAGARFELCPGQQPIYRDLHGAGPIPEQSLAMFAELLPRLPNLRAVTVEVETATEQQAVAQVAQVRAVAREVRADYRASYGTSHCC